jgi:uncharacterized membrane protein YeaQ/YmgE (transglycosylase-associated protein family)
LARRAFVPKLAKLRPQGLKRLSTRKISFLQFVPTAHRLSLRPSPGFLGWEATGTRAMVGARQIFRDGGTMPTLSQVIVWSAIGLIGGTLAAMAVTWGEGYGLIRNLGLGLAGALIGGFLFRVFGLFPRLDLFSISLRDVVAAFAGSLLVLAGLWLWHQYQARSHPGAKHFS